VQLIGTLPETKDYTTSQVAGFCGVDNHLISGWIRTNVVRPEQSPLHRQRKLWSADHVWRAMVAARAHNALVGLSGAGARKDVVLAIWQALEGRYDSDTRHGEGFLIIEPPHRAIVVDLHDEVEIGPVTFRIRLDSVVFRP